MTNDLIQIQNGKVAFDSIESLAPAAGGCGSTPAGGQAAAQSGCGSGCGCASQAPGAIQTATPANFIPLGAVGAPQPKMELADVRAKLQDKKGPEFWRSLNELAQSPQFDDMMAREFKSAPASWEGVSRRDFLKLAGASLALAGLAGCAKQPEERIHPYVNQPEDLVPGRALFFATAASKSGAPGFGYAIGVLGESHMGRPTKLEGNPDHPSSRGRSDVITQGTLYTLYDPDRSQNVTRNGEESSWDSAKGELTEVLAKLRGTRGEGLRILSESITSPTLAAQMQELLHAYPQARWHVWDAVNNDNRRAALGTADPVYHFDRAKVIVSLDSNFFQDEPGSVRYALEYSDNRRVRTRQNKMTMNRLYVVESTPTITGANADHRWPVKSSEVVAVAQRLLPGAGATKLPTSISDKEISAIAADLAANRGTSLVIAGPTQPPEVHALAHRINVALGNVGKTVTYVESVTANPVDNLGSLRNLVADMNAGHVNTLVILGANPVYTAPVDLKFLDAFKKVKTRVRLGLYDDETSNWCHWHIPQRHFLEDWSDARGHDGTASIVQPVIAPLYDGVSAHQLLSIMSGRGDRNPYAIVREYWSARSGGGDFEAWWRKALNDGVIPNTAARPTSVAVRSFPSTPAPTSGLEINFYPDPHIWDGAHSNNGWLQELPKPMTKSTWENLALISLNTAREQNVDNYDIVQLTVGGNTVEAPIWILPGQPDNQLTVHLGYGRTRAGSLASMGEPEVHPAGESRAADASGSMGFNAYLLRTSKNLWANGGAQIQKTGRKARLAITQENHMVDNRNRPSPPGLLSKNGDGDTMDSTHDRHMIQVLSIEEFRKNPNAFRSEGKSEEEPEGHGESTHGAEAEVENHEVGSEYEPNIMPRIWPSDRKGVDANGVPIYDQDKKYYAGNPIPAWGMTIDLNTCIGCNTCTIACQAENNIASVGKDQVVRGREMHWIRVDRYYRGDVSNPESYHQPVPCMHCEKAPCEPVCPVEATTHSVEGINEMTYNRCVGTKYCSNNCPYKVRRFNFLQYSEQDNVSLSMMKNPDVTVRSRGVMEKCTYCIQRINDTRWQAEKAGRAIRDGEFTTACAQACPTNAIIFGNINDKKSAVYEAKAEPHNYGLLEQLNTFPRTTYLAKLRNPNPALEKPGV